MYSSALEERGFTSPETSGVWLDCSSRSQSKGKARRYFQLKKLFQNHFLLSSKKPSSGQTVALAVRSDASKSRFRNHNLAALAAYLEIRFVNFNEIFASRNDLARIDQLPVTS